MLEQNEIDASAFKDIEAHLEGYNKQHAYGIVLKPKASPDISKYSIKDPKLHNLLMSFGRQYVPIPFTTVDLHWTNKSQKLKYQNNYTEGKSFIVAFGSYIDGDIIYNSKQYSIKHRPLVLDGNLCHTINTFCNCRFYMVYYTIKHSKAFPMVRTLNDYEAVCKDNKYVMVWYRDGLPSEYLTKDHPLVTAIKTKKKKDMFPIRGLLNPLMSKAQNLMLWSQKENIESPEEK